MKIAVLSVYSNLNDSERPLGWICNKQTSAKGGNRDRCTGLIYHYVLLEFSFKKG